MVWRGLKEEAGFWKIGCTFRRIASSRRATAGPDVLPVQDDAPGVGRISRRIRRSSVDLPEPDSPTMPSVSPRRDRQRHLDPTARRGRTGCLPKVLARSSMRIISPLMRRPPDGVEILGVAASSMRV